jgi:thymidylate kinase
VIRAALERLAAEGVAFATRGNQPVDDPPPGGDVDILVSTADRTAAHAVLEGAGFHHQLAPGHRGHRFYLRFDTGRGRWLKIDVNLVPEHLGWDLTARDDEHLRRFAGYRVGAKSHPRLAERVWAALAQRRPLGLRRMGPVIAVLGPDGAGKGSVIAALREQIPAVVKPIYLGHGAGSREQYGAAVRGAAARRQAGGALRRWLRPLVAGLPVQGRASLYRIRLALLGSMRALEAYAHAWTGSVVLCDRHPIELLAVGVAEGHRRPALERAILARLVPWPDAVILLDAPGAVLFARKGEHSPERLEAERRAYRDFFVPRGASLVPTDASLDAGVSLATAAVWRAFAARRQW